MRTLVVATNQEMQLALSILPNEKFKSIIITGVGALNTIQSLRYTDRADEIINIGYVGSLNIPIGTQCKIGKVSTYHSNCDFDEVPIELLDGDIPCYTSCDFVVNADKKDCVFDMELAFIASLGFKRIRSIKVVSDNLDYSQYKETIKK